MAHFFNFIARRKYALFISFGCLLFSIPLISYAYNGSFMRLSGDDYCYAASLTEYGFWKAQSYSYLHAMPYHGDRYSLTFFSSLSNVIGPSFNGVLPGLAILLWVLGSGLVIASINKITHLDLYKPEILLLSEEFVFLTFYQSPNLAQTLYWRSAMLPYTASLVTTTFILALILREGLLQNSNAWAMGLAFFLALIAGGFSETGVSILAGILIMLAVYLIYHYLVAKEWKIHLFRMITAAFAGALIAALVLAVSPSIKHMLKEPFSIYRLTNSIGLASLASWAFMTQSLRGLPIPNAVTFITFACVSFFTSLRNSGKGISFREHFFSVPLCAILTCFILTIFCMAPNELARTLYPDPRVLITARSVLVVTVAVCGYWVGRGISYFIQNLPFRRFLQILVMITLVLICFYPLYTTRSILSITPVYHKWSRLWDERNQAILAAQRSGIQDVHVMRLKNIIPGVGDLSDVDYWYNRCAARYYNVKTITADQPGWDK